MRTANIHRSPCLKPCGPCWAQLYASSSGMAEAAVVTQSAKAAKPKNAVVGLNGFSFAVTPFAFTQRIVDLVCRRGLLRLPASPHCTLCTIRPRRAGGGTCRADARAMQIGTHIVYSLTLFELLSGTAFD